MSKSKKSKSSEEGSGEKSHPESADKVSILFTIMNVVGDCSAVSAGGRGWEPTLPFRGG